MSMSSLMELTLQNTGSAETWGRENMDHESHWGDGIGSFPMFSKRCKLKIRVIFITSFVQIANIFYCDSFHVDSD